MPKPDDDVIDISHMTDEDRREHLRRISQLQTCPCVYCTAICDRMSTIAECEPYQDWLRVNEKLRGIQRRNRR